MSNHRNFISIGLDGRNRKSTPEFVAAERRGSVVTHHRVAAHTLTEAVALLERDGLAAPGWFDEVHGTWARHNAAVAA